MLPLDEAQKIVLAEASSVPASVPLSEGLGRVLARDLMSPQASPLFDNSAMDGFALSLSAEEVPPYRRRIVGEIPAGQVWQGAELDSETTVRIMTGAAVPASAQAVVPIEEVHEVQGGIEIQVPIRPGQHIRRQGEEYLPGDRLLPAGTVLNPAAIGLLASLGQSEVSIYRPPRVAILATGSELLPLDAPLVPGKLRDSNSATLAACVRAAGAEPVPFGILPDQPERIREALQQAFASCDLVLTSGGVSVGDYDYVQEILLELGLQKKFWKVAIKPGKPVLFGTLNQKLLFGIPGNPASALVVFEVLVRPVLRKLLGHRELFRPERQGTLQAEVKATSGRLHLMRVHYRDGQINPLKGQSSSNLWTVSQANALLPVYRDYAAGEAVLVWRLD